jgi:hypothetical protein
MTISGSDQSVTIAGTLTANGSSITPSQWTSNSTAIYYNTGNVGIGTSSPTSQLAIFGDASQPTISLQRGTTGTGKGALAFGTSSAVAASIRANSTANSAASGSMTFAVADSGGTNQDRMVIDSSGNVGIGTSSPSSFGKLAVVNNGTNGLVVSDNSSTDFRVDTTGSVTTIRNSAVASLAFSTNGGERMRIDSSGNVGIGTSSPTWKLDIANASSFDGLRLIRTGNNSQFSVRVDSGTAIMNSTGSGSNAIAFNTENTERVRITSTGLLQFNSGYGSVATAYGCRAWVNFNGTGTVAIRASGNVSSIGDNGTGNYTINFSTAMPDVNYSVNTTINLALAQTLGVISGPYNFNVSYVDITVRNTEDNASVDPTTLSAVIFR